MSESFFDKVNQQFARGIQPYGKAVGYVRNVSEKGVTPEKLMTQEIEDDRDL